MTPLISVVIPSLNKSKHIGRAIQSILDQKIDRLEIIIQDGGSSDGTVDIIKSYATKHPDIVKYESKRDGGQLVAINNGLKKAKGEILTYINADDYYSEGAFLALYEKYKQNPNAMWFAGRGVIVNSEGGRIFSLVSLYKDILLNLNSRLCLLVTNYLIQPSVFFTRKTYDIYGPFIGTKDFILEYDLWLRISKDQMPIILNKELSNFRMESGTKTMTLGSDILEKDQELVQQYTDNKIILCLHWIHNKIRLFILKTHA